MRCSCITQNRFINLNDVMQPIGHWYGVACAQVHISTFSHSTALCHKNMPESVPQRNSWPVCRFILTILTVSRIVHGTLCNPQLETQPPADEVVEVLFQGERRLCAAAAFTWLVIDMCQLLMKKYIKRSEKINKNRKKIGEKSLLWEGYVGSASVTLPPAWLLPLSSGLGRTATVRCCAERLWKHQSLVLLWWMCFLFALVLCCEK